MVVAVVRVVRRCDTKEYSEAEKRFTLEGGGSGWKE
jgi:hypothetical protein